MPLSTVGSVTGDNDAEKIRDETAQSFPPSHILQDGRYIYLPPPTEAEKGKFLERSIVRHDLVQSDLSSTTKEEEKQEKEKDKQEDSTQPTIHPLAVASARLQANGIAELSKAVNLSGLVSTGEYFGLTNIVDPSLEVTEKADAATNSQKLSLELADERLKAEYIGKRKRAQFEQAQQVLERHSGRLAAAISAQTVMDERLRQLRPSWRLVAPEHGTRALPHAALPSELVAIDVDVYDRDRTGGGNQAVLLGRSTTMGRIARRVPRFVTIELQDDYKVSNDLAIWKKKYAATKDYDDDMEVEAVNKQESNESSSIKTRAEPFAVADPTLGKIDVEFDPEKVPMLTLQFEISKPSTGFLQSARLSPSMGHSKEEGSDENVIVSLQHSLFCASLFESIRRELVPEDDDKTVGSVKSKTHRAVWLSSEMDENFLPPPSLMAGGENSSGNVRSLAVVHCHEGEVMVQLDCEYSLTVKLVEASGPLDSNNDDNAMDIDEASGGTSNSSGSQTPEQLQVLCRALLLHAQNVYHEHSMKARARALEKKQEQAPGLARIQKQDKMPSARILESCVNLGAKMIFEGKIRRALRVGHDYRAA